MAKLVPLTLVALCLFAAPALAQDSDVPDMDRWAQQADKFMRKVEELIQPLMKQIEDTLRAITHELENMLEEMDPNDMFGEFDFEQWADELRRMFEGLQPRAPQGQDRDMRDAAPSAFIC
jgi:Skp family chaperone for outer membrane proteins